MSNTDILGIKCC